MKKSYLIAISALATMVVSSCSSDNELMENRSIDVMEKEKQENRQIGTALIDSFAVTSDTEAMAYVLEAPVTAKGDTLRHMGRVIETQPLYRDVITINLGSKETKEYGEWRAEFVAPTPKAVETKAGYGHFTVTTNESIVNSTTSNGDVEFNPVYTLRYESCVWSDGDTTFVFPCTWEVTGEVTKVDADGKVNDELSLCFCEFNQKANEFGTLVLSSTPTDENTAVSADFSVTIFGSKWLVGCSVHMSDGTLACALEPDGKPIATRANFWAGDVNASYNGAYYVEVKGEGAWYPAIARDRNDGMSWTVGQKEINIISYAEADQYSHWGNDNKNIYGQHSVKLTGYSVTDDAQSQTLTFFYNGKEAGTLCYANLK